MKRKPVSLNRDVSTFFTCFSYFCRQADGLLFRSGNAEAVDETCKRAPVGKLLPNALYVHRDALDSLEPLLRVYEGCARAYLGEVEGANLIKLHRHSGKVSYLVYPDFATVPHPALPRSIKLSLRTRELDCYDYATSTNPPILHRKETFLPPGHPHMAKFTRLTRQEEKHGLLDETATIGTRGLAAAAGGAGIHDSRASAGAAEGSKGRRGGTTKLTKHTKRREDVEREGRVCLGLAASCQQTLNKRPQCDLACGLDVDSVYNVSMAGVVIRHVASVCRQAREA